eukprot:CCRYP_013637-RA/>CCRYP_013637-RA protein AED:0.13 eAED:0.13 QI:3/1/1/1/0/0/2/195/44
MPETFHCSWSLFEGIGPFLLLLVRAPSQKDLQLEPKQLDHLLRE